MSLLIVFSLILWSLAALGSHDPRIIHVGHRSFVIPVADRSLTGQGPLRLDNNASQALNLEQFLRDEYQRLLVKYRRVPQSLQSGSGIGDPKFPLGPPTELPEPPARPSPSSPATAKVPLKDFFQDGLDTMYSADIGVGTPRQPFSVAVDTGSADLFIPSSNCVDGQCGNHRKFNDRASTTFVRQGTNVSLFYGSGESQGYLGQDVVSMGGLTVENQSFIAVSNESNDFKVMPNDGLIGMAFSSIAVSGKLTFFENLILSRIVSNSRFSLHLGRGLVSRSELCLGCFDPTKAIGPTVYIPVVSKTYWSLAMDGLVIDSVTNSTELVVNDVIAAIDSGTTLIYIPNDLADRFYASIPGSRQVVNMGESFYSYPCDYHFTASIIFGGHKFGINTTTDFNLGRLSENSSECVGGIMALPSADFPANLAIVGVEFLKSWYTVFDYSDTARVGFASSINNLSV